MNNYFSNHEDDESEHDESEHDENEDDENGDDNGSEYDDDDNDNDGDALKLHGDDNDNQNSTSRNNIWGGGASGTGNVFGIVSEDARNMVHQNTKSMTNKQLNIKNSIKKNIIIDSEYRQNILPHNIDSNSRSSSTNYLIQLNVPIKNVISLELQYISIPTAWYTFDYHIGNTYFYIDNSCIQISVGNYTPTTFVDTLNASINDAIPDLSNIIHLNTITNKIYIDEVSPTVAKRLIIYDKTNTYNPPITEPPTNKGKINLNLMWLMGFRVEEDISGITYILLNKKQTAHTSINIFGPKYFTIAIDDYNPYIYNNDIGMIGNPLAQMRQTWSYYTTAKKEHIDGTTTVVEDNHRKLTRATINAMNEINANNPVDNHRTTNYTTNNILAILPITENAMSNQKYNKPFSIGTLALTNNIRNYPSPIDIYQMKISLYDPYGYVVNLQGADWSVTLLVEYLNNYTN